MRSMKPSAFSLAALFLVASPAPSAPFPIAGIPNFRQVDDTVFRGGQPRPSAWGDLAKLGVKTVVDLRQLTEHSTTDEARMVQATGMRYVSVPMDGFAMPDPAKVQKVLEVLQSGDPVFVHCAQGRDRTGTAIAVYRMAHQGWACDKALTEAKACGLHWYERGMMRYILAYQAAPGRLMADQGVASVPHDSTLVVSPAAVTDSLGSR